VVTLLLLHGCAGPPDDGRKDRVRDPDDSALADTAPDTGGDTAPRVDPFDQDGDGVRTVEGDCDDRDANVYPGAPDGCDALDQDCDGEAIPEGSCGEVVLLDQGYAGAWEGDAGSNGLRLWQAHTDHSGDGAPDLVALGLCTPWYGESHCSSNLLILPSRMPDGFEPVPTADTAVLLADPTHDWMVAGGAAGDFDGDGWEDLFYASSGYDYALGRVYIVRGPPAEWPGGGGFTTDLAAGWWDDGGEREFVRDVSAGEDIDGDGMDDLLLTTPDTFVLRGRAEIPRDVSLWDELWFGGMSSWHGMLPDIDGDGLAEAVVVGVGALAFLAPAAISANVSGVGLSEVSDSVGMADYPAFGVQNAPAGLGDVTGDGYADASLFVTESFASGSTPGVTCFAVLLGGSDLRTAGSEAPLDRFICLEDGEQYQDINPDYVIPDLDGDGQKDLLIQDPYDGLREDACIVASTWMPTSGRVMIDEIHPYCFGLSGEYRRGAGVADLDGDGLPELLASDYEYENNGIIYVAPGFEIPFGDASKW
jgi:hypothetical protein